MKFPMGGALDGVKESDWVLGKTLTVEEIPEAPMRFENTQWEVNQDSIAPNICTICDAWGAVSDVTGYRPTDEDILEVMNIGINDYDGMYQFDPSVGRYLHLAVDEVRKSANRKGLELSSMAVPIGNNEHYIALEKGYTVATGHKANRAYNKDRDDDGVLSVGGVNSPVTYGHANGHFEYKSSPQLHIRDSYLGRKTNIYKNNALDGMIEAKRQFRRGFIFFTETTMDLTNLPPHISRASVTGDDRDIVIARETEVSKEIVLGYEPIYKNYEGSRAVERMLIELAKIR